MVTPATSNQHAPALLLKERGGELAAVGWSQNPQRPLHTTTQANKVGSHWVHRRISLQTPRYHPDVFADLLDPVDAERATKVVKEIRRHGLRCALTGGLAIEAHLRARRKPTERRHLNDIDFVVAGFDSIPESLSQSFLQYHVHPDATDGKTLLQLVDRERRVRVDLFAALGESLSRAHPLNGPTSEVDVLSIEDLVARTTALVCGRLTRRRVIEAKHVAAFMRLRGLGNPQTLAAAWADHRQQVSGSLEDASQEAVNILNSYPGLVTVDLSLNAAQCERCRPHRGFRPAAPARIREILGYC